MTAQSVGWDEVLGRSKGLGFLAQQFFVVLTEPTNSLAEIEEVLKEHLQYQVKLEKQGRMFAAGPLCDVATGSWLGRGLVIIRADSLEEAKDIAAGDPMHVSGARRFEVIPWCMNEGGFDLRVRLSSGTAELLGGQAS